MESDKTFKLPYRMMQIAIAMACFLLGYMLYNHHYDVERDNEILSKHNELILSSQKTLDDVRQQQIAAKELLAASQSRLRAAESRQAAEKAGASQKAQ